MAHQFTRLELYELVWSKPTKRLAADLGLSDVGLAKACRKVDIPVPERGYWARKEAGKPTFKRPLPPRFPGASNSVEFGSGRQNDWRTDWLLTEPLPPPPVFDEEISLVAERVRKMVGKVTCSKNLTNAHRLIAVLLERDEKRRAERARTGYSWHQPQYESASEKRRLRILDTIFTATQRLGCKPSMSTSQYDPNPHQASVVVGGQDIAFTLEPVVAKGAAANKATTSMRMTIRSRRHDAPALKSWIDTDEAPLENFMTDMVVEIVLAAEIFYRENMVSHHEWLIERKAQLEEEVRRRKIEEERKARELRARQEKERIDRLLAQAEAVHQSATIRTYVQAVLGRSSEMPIDAEDLGKWAAWALSEADRIDPVKNGAIAETVREIAGAEILALPNG